MWRALTQWFGGVGIIVLFIAVFPTLFAIAGRQLFFAEAPGPTEDKLTPRLRNTSNAVLLVYVGLTVLCALAYALAGMSFYDAVAHAFTTLAAGGFSPNGLSFQGFANPALGLGSHRVHALRGGQLRACSTARVSGQAQRPLS